MVAGVKRSDDIVLLAMVFAAAYLGCTYAPPHRNPRRRPRGGQ